MVAAAAGIQFLHAGLLLQAFGAYVAVLSEERGWSKTALSGGAALQSIEGALLGPALGWLIDRFGPRAMIQIGIVVFGLGFIALSRIDTLGGFYAAVLVIAVGASLSGYFPLTIALVHWFQRRRARALSIMGLGLARRRHRRAAGGLGDAELWLAHHGFRLGRAHDPHRIAAGTCHPPPTRRRRGDRRWTASSPGRRSGVRQPRSPHEREFTAREALRTRAFWLLALAHGFALLVVTAVNVHAISHMKEGLGYSLAQASLAITLMTVAQVGRHAVGRGWSGTTGKSAMSPPAACSAT